MLCIVILPLCHLVRLVSVVLISVSSPFVIWYLCIYCLSLHLSFLVSSVVASSFTVVFLLILCFPARFIEFDVLFVACKYFVFDESSALMLLFGAILVSQFQHLGPHPTCHFLTIFFTFFKTTLHNTCAPDISKRFLLCTLLVVAKKITLANHWRNSICLILFCKKPKKKKEKEKKDHLCKRPAESSESLLFGWIYCLAERQRPLSLESSIS